MIVNLIADAGSTKTDWVITDPKGERITSIITNGVNALLCAPGSIKNMATMVGFMLHQENMQVNSLHYYGAGCATPKICHSCKKELGQVIHAKEIRVNSDLLGAARSLLQKEPGIACILGTGSNSCLYDGKKIVRNVPSMGYVLGDEGSGAALGRRLVADVFRGLMPRELRDLFFEKYDIDLGEMLDNVYKQASPNQYLAEFVEFIAENIEHEYMAEMVKEEIGRYFDRNITCYAEAKEVPISFTGGVSKVFQEIIRMVGTERGYRIGEILNPPMEGLIRYHKLRR
ncbi:MAG: BadF/BadG/BcrA/BcrD ATPase family protein [Lepagella sp.]